MTSFEFENPAVFLLLIPLLPLLAWRLYKRPTAPALLFPTIVHVRRTGKTLRQRLLRLLPLMQIVAVVLLVTAAARPRKGDEHSLIRREGVALQMVLDVSGSMAEEIRYANTSRPKVDIVKEIFADFVAGSDDLPGRKTDLIGLTTFARYPRQDCPLISPHEPLLTAVKNLKPEAPYLTRYRRPTWDRTDAAHENPLNATAIGDGLYRAVLSLVTAEQDLAREQDDDRYTIKSRAVIVLTDGQNNTGMNPAEAGEYAAANDVKVYFIVLMDRNRYGQTILGRQVVRQLSDAAIDQFMQTPRTIADRTGGRAWFAADGDELREVYKEIDGLERSRIGRIEFRTYQERYSWFLLPAIGLLVLTTLLGETVLRRIP